MARSPWPILLLSVFVGACAVGPDYQVPEFPVPDQWEAAAAADVTGDSVPILDWWSVFGDAELDTLMIRAREANRDLRIAVARVAETRALRAVASGDFWPQVQGDGSFSRSDGPLQAGPASTW